VICINISFFGDNDFSFLDTYRDKCNGEDESDDDRSQIYIGSSSSDAEDNEQDCNYIGVDSFDFEPPQSPVAPDTPVEVEGQEDSDGEPSPWKDSRAKKRIIVELKKDNSTIHAMEVKEVHGTFASRYVLKLCNIYYLLLHFKERVHFNIIREKNRYAFKAMFVPLHFVFCPSLAVSEPIF